MYELIANIGMALLLVGTFPSMYTLLKNWKNLKGFSIFGSLFILFGQTTYFLYFAMQKDFLTSLLSLPLIVFWIMVVIFARRRKE